MTPHQPDQVVEAALTLRDAGRAEDAVLALDAAIASNPGNARLWQTLGLIQRASGDGAAAATAFERAARLAPADIKIAHGLAQSSLEAGYPATTLFDRVLALAGGDSDILIGRAGAQIGEGNIDAAIADLGLVVGNNPLWLPGQSTLARLRWIRGDGPESTRAIEHALTANAGHPALWGAYLNALIEVGRYGDAERAVAEARKRFPADPALDLFEASIASELGDVGRADAVFARVTVASDGATAARFARHLIRAGRADAAATLIAPLLERPDSDALWPYAALAWRLTGDPRWEWLEGDPRLIGTYDLGLSSGELAQLAHCLRALHVGREGPAGQSVRGGTQTDGPLFMRAEPEIRDLRARIVAAVHDHMRALPPIDPRHPTLRHRPARVRFSGSWSVRLTGVGAGHHANHVHPQGWLSSACHVVVPTEEELGASPAGWLEIGAPPSELGLDLPPFRSIAPRAGTLVLFPSTMWHGARAFDSGERLTVAFDVAG